jgi:hypothetical protein
MVAFEVVAEEREAEAPLSLERAVAGPAVAAESADEREYVTPEVGLFQAPVGRVTRVDPGHDGRLRRHGHGVRARAEHRTRTADRGPQEESLDFPPHPRILPLIPGYGPLREHETPGR